jgi:hypothetical protein
MSSRALEGDRQLHKEIPPVTVATWDPGTAQWIINPSTGWLDTDALSVPNAVYYETYFDTSGYELDDLTLGPLNIFCQDPGIYQVANSADARLRVLDIVSQERLDVGQVVTNMATLNGAPGSSVSKDDWTQILYGRFRLMVSNTLFATPDLLQTIRDTSFGSMAPSAASKLWVYRIVIPSGTFTGTTTLSVPASRMILQANIFKEGELEYLMRLKRSFELGTD